MAGLDFWYSPEVQREELIAEWIEIVDLVPMLQVTGTAWTRLPGSSELESSWETVTLDGDPVFFSIDLMRDNFRRVALHSRDELSLENLLHAYYGLSRPLQPLETALTRLCAYDSGPLLSFCAAPSGVLNCLQGIRVLSRRLYSNLERVASLAPRYCTRAEFLGDNLLLDFGDKPRDPLVLY